MAGIVASVTTGGTIALTLATAKTVLQVTAPTNQRLRIREITISGYTTGTDAPIAARILFQTGGTGSGSSTATPVNRSGTSETVQGTAKKGYTAEPTAGNVYEEYTLPAAGNMRLPFYGDQLVVTGGSTLGIELTAAAANSARAKIEWEE